MSIRYLRRCGRPSVMQNPLGIITMPDAASRVRCYTFDGAGKKTVTQFPERKIATFAFDALNGAITTIIWEGSDYLGEVS